MLVFGAPRGLFLDELIETTRRELFWETDYLREAQYQKNYKKKLEPYPNDYYTPAVYDDLSTKKILCSEFIDGVEIDAIQKETQ